MNTTCAFRSQRPDVLEAWAAIDRGIDEWHERCGQLQAEFPDHAVVTRRRGWMFWVSGLRGECPGPDWCQDRYGDWVPRRNTRSGKALNERMKGLRTVHTPLPGMPSELSADGSFQSPGVRLLDGWVYVDWDCDTERVIQRGVDLTRWERCPLSKFYAALEAAEAGGDA